MTVGLFALQGERVYLNEQLLKSNNQPCVFPMENWLLPKQKQLFIPLTSWAVSALDLLEDEKFLPPAELLTPDLCGILICANTKVYEVGMTKTGLAKRRVPVMLTSPAKGVGVRYVRAAHRDLEEAFTAALRITDSLEKSNELVRQTTLSLPGLPIYTTLPQLVWAAITQDVSVVRAKMTRNALSQRVKKELPAIIAESRKKDAKPTT